MHDLACSAQGFQKVRHLWVVILLYWLPQIALADHFQFLPDYLNIASSIQKGASIQTMPSRFRSAFNDKDNSETVPQRSIFASGNLHSAHSPLVHELVESMALARPNHIAVNVVCPSTRLGSETTSKHSSCLDRDASDHDDQDLAVSGPASKDTEIAFTYSEINRYANNAADKLRAISMRPSISVAEGGGPSDPGGKPNCIVLLVDEGVGLVVSELAVLKAGAAFVPVDPVWPPERIAFIVKDCAASAVIVSKAGAAECIRKLEAGGVQTVQEAKGERALNCIPVVEIESAMEPAGGIGAARRPGAKPHAASAAGGTDVEPTARSCREVCHIIYTSGSTGQPKGVVCEHRSLASFVAAKAAAHGIDGAARVLVAAASTWDPSVGDLFCALAAGATACIAPRAALVEQLAAVVQRSRASHLSTTPALWGMLPPELAPPSLPHLRVLALGGERLPDAVARKWGRDAGGLWLLNTYGVTEATVYQTTHHVQVPADGAIDILAGRPMQGVEVAVDGDPAMAGECDGEILIGGVQVARGYLNRPELTAEKFFMDKDGTRWFRSGDRGRWVFPKLSDTRDGQREAARPVLQLLGRIDLQVKLRGFRIELEEVEAVIKQCPLVRNVAVVLHADGANTNATTDRDEAASSSARLVAFVELNEGNASTFQQGGEIALRLHCQRKMPAYQVPAQLVCVSSLPLTSSGKLNRKALPPAPPIKARDASSWDLAGMGGLVDPRTKALEGAVARLWEEVLGVEKVGRWDHFWELGGNSVVAVRMLHRLEERLGESLVPTTTGRWASTPEDRGRVRLCGLHRKPRLKDFVRFLEWAAVTAPNAVESVVDAGEKKEQGGTGEKAVGVGNQAGQFAHPQVGVIDKGHGGPENEEDVLGLLDASRPVAEDEHDMERAAMTLAAKGGHVEVLRCLLALGASPEGWAVHDHVPSPLMLASSRGHLEVVQELLQANASIRPVDSLHNNALHLASAGGHVSVIELLLSPEVGVPRDARTLNKWSVVHHAAFHGHVAGIRALVRSGASLNLKDRWGRTPLAWAVFKGHVAAAEYLVEAGGRLCEGGEHGRNQPQLARQRRLGNRWSPAIMLAVQALQRSYHEGGERELAGGEGEGLGVLGLLVRHGAALAVRVDATDAEGRTALHHACMRPAHAAADDGVQGDHVAWGAEPGQASSMPADSTTERMSSWAACSGAIIQCLLQAGANVNARDLAGKSPLHCAVEDGNAAAVELLLEAGADPAARDKRGRPVVDMALVSEGANIDFSCFGAEACRSRIQKALQALPTSQFAMDSPKPQLEQRSHAQAFDHLEYGWLETQNQQMGARFFVRVAAWKE